MGKCLPKERKMASSNDHNELKKKGMNNNTKEGKFAFIYSAKFFSSLNFLISFHFSMMLLRLNGWKNTDKVYYLSAMMPRVALLDREKSQGSHKFSILFLNRRMSINFLLNSPCKIAKWMASEWTRKKLFSSFCVWMENKAERASWRVFVQR